MQARLCMDFLTMVVDVRYIINIKQILVSGSYCVSLYPSITQSPIILSVDMVRNKGIQSILQHLYINIKELNKSSTHSQHNIITCKE